MVALPPVTPTTGSRLTARLPRDHCVRLAANDHSVHPSVVSRRVDVSADLIQVSAVCDGREVARHPRCGQGVMLPSVCVRQDLRGSM